MSRPERRATERYEAASHVVFEEVDAAVVLLDTKSGKFFGLNSTGEIIWRALHEGGATVDELVEKLQALADAPAEVRAHVEELLAELERRSLIRQVGPPFAS